MPNFMLLLHDREGFGEGMSPEQIQAVIQKYSDWAQRMGQRGVLQRGVKLQDGTGKLVRGVPGKPVVTDGPFAESKEIVGGFFEITADNFDAAAELCSDCPHLDWGTIEIRQIEIH